MDGDQRLRVGELAKLAGVTARTIRHYEQRGLIAEPTRGRNGYRLYEPGALLALAEIRRLRAVGLSLADIAAVRADDHAPDDAAALSARLDELDADLGREVEALTTRRESLRQVRAALAEGDAILARPAPPAFDELESLLRTHGASPAAIDEERRVWAALDGLELPANWRDTIADGVRELPSHPDQLEGFAEVLEIFATLRHAEVDDSLIDRAVDRLAAIAIRHTTPPALALLQDPALPPIVETISSCFSPAQLRAMVMMALRVVADRRLSSPGG